MGRMGRTKHLKRLNAPKHWMLDKLSGVFAPKVCPGPHKTRECLPLAVILRNRLKYALTYKETMSILMQRLVKVDGKVRTQQGYPAGFMDVLTLEKTDENFRLLRAHLAVNLDQALHQDGHRLLVREGVLEAVAQDDGEGQALARLVGPRAHLRGEDARELVQHPVLGRVQALEVLRAAHPPH